MQKKFINMANESQQLVWARMTWINSQQLHYFHEELKHHKSRSKFVTNWKERD